MLSSEFWGKAVFLDIMQRDNYNCYVDTCIQHILGYTNEMKLQISKVSMHLCPDKEQKRNVNTSIQTSFRRQR